MLVREGDPAPALDSQAAVVATVAVTSLITSSSTATSFCATLSSRVGDSDEKAGRDAGDIVGIEKTGVIATQDVDEIMALEPDCVLYCPLPWDTAEICRLLESGRHSVSEVATLVGYDNPSAFAHAFQLRFGRTPSELLPR